MRGQVGGGSAWTEVGVKGRRKGRQGGRKMKKGRQVGKSME